MNNIPFVSIIVPVYNSEGFIGKNIESLLNQSYPKERYEILIVDNASTDNTQDVIRQYPVTLLEEKNIQGSYAARNKAILHAKGDVLAFTDADCIVTRDWVQHGVHCLEQKSADIVGGKVSFLLSDKSTAAEQLDSLTNMHNRSAVAKGSAKTANILAYASVFKKVGLFPAEMKSGGDVAWTSRAVDMGMNLVYCSDAVVMHPARTFGELIKKQYRVGTGAVAVWKERKKSPIWIGLAILAHVIPLDAFYVVNTYIKARGEDSVKYKTIRMGLVLVICRLAGALGIVVSLFPAKKK